MRKITYADGIFTGTCTTHDTTMLTGTGKYVYTTGETYTGEFVNGYYENYGELSTPTYVYKGMWHKNTQNGRGKYTDIIRQFTYKGLFADGMFNGAGKIKYTNGCKMSGIWHNNIVVANALVEYPDGTMYRGELSRDTERQLHHGKGQLYRRCLFRNILIYDGMWKDGLYSGYGKLYYPTGELWCDGNWLEGQLCGKYTVYTEKGKVISDNNNMINPLVQATTATATATTTAACKPQGVTAVL